MKNRKYYLYPDFTDDMESTRRIERKITIVKTTSIRIHFNFTLQDPSAKIIQYNPNDILISHNLTPSHGRKQNFTQKDLTIVIHNSIYNI